MFEMLDISIKYQKILGKSIGLENNYDESIEIQNMITKISSTNLNNLPVKMKLIVFEG